ncbi:MAG: hypothetical protein H0X01_00595 [Nitrospira sp.]|nr:hypothetical protein [Nitrospira sp.]
MLPKHIHVVKWKSGTVAYYWQPHRGTAREGARVRLPDDPASAAFWLVVKALQDGPKPTGGIGQMIDAYQDSPHYKGLADSTRREYGRYLDELRSALASYNPDDLQPKDVAEFRDTMGDTPAKANAYIRAIAALYSWGRERGFAKYNPADDITKLKIGEHPPWPIWAWETATTLFREEIRLACFLGRYTGQRLGDVLRMRLTDIGPDGLYVRQQKGKKELTVPLHYLLLPIIADCRRRGKIYLVSRNDGSPFTVDQFHAMWGREMARSQELMNIRTAGLSFHGLRKTLVVSGAESDLTGHQIGSITGQTIQTVQHYSKGASQKRLAKEGMRKLEGRGE